MNKAKFTVNISGVSKDIEVYVNNEGNLVLEGVGSVHYEMYEGELVLMSVKPEKICYSIEELRYALKFSENTPVMYVKDIKNCEEFDRHIMYLVHCSSHSNYLG